MTFASSFGYFADVTTTLIGRELRIRYKGSLLGLLWSILSPLGTVAILHILFSRILPLGIPHYAAFIYSGLLPWTWFQAAVQTSAATLLDNRDLVRKPFFPRSLLPVVVTGSNFVLYVMAVPVLLAVVMIEGVQPSALWLLLPLVWLVQAIFTLACAVLVAALGVLIRDVQHLLGVGMLLWFYLTPIFYNLDNISPGNAHWLMLNPMTVFVEAHRSLTFYGRMPDWGKLGMQALLGSVLLAFSLAIFRMLEDAFVEEV